MGVDTNRRHEEAMNELFQVHMLNVDGRSKARAIAELFDELLTKLQKEMGSAPSRYASLVNTHLEQACFYAKKNIATDSANQEAK